MIFALHGFLGLPSDWEPFAGAFRDRAGAAIALRKWDLYADAPPSPPGAAPMRVWARDFCRRVADERAARGPSGSAKPILLGYSLGGRLALHALLEKPELFACAVIVGAHPGLTAADLKLQRRSSDDRWAERFHGEEWSSLARAWGEQDVFRARSRAPGAIELARREVDFDRASLSRAMRAWSLAGQEDLRAELADARVPTLWLVGALDRRFRGIYRELRVDLADSPAHAFAEIPDAGHRVPWENPAGFAAEVQKFFNQVV